MKKRVLMGLACAGAVALLVAMVAGAAASPSEITLLSRAGIPFKSMWAGTPGPGGAVEVPCTGWPCPSPWNSQLVSEGAAWIWSESPVSGGRGQIGDVVEFTDTFELECTPISAQLALDITADNEYRVHLNGTQVADSTWTVINPDSCPRYEDHYTYRSVHHYDISEPFQSGTNTLVFEILNLPCYSDSGNPGGLIYKAVITYNCPIQVQIDIKPGSYPNCFNINDHGVIPVAILGSADFDVNNIDPSTVQMEGLSVKVVGKGDKLLAHIEDVNGDGWDDLVVQIEDQDGALTGGNGIAKITGDLYDGTPIEGTDSICVVP